METISHFAEAWMPVFVAHMAEVSVFILLVWVLDRILRLNTRMRYALWLLALVKVFVPPLFSLPAPVYQALSTPVTLRPVIAGLQAAGRPGTPALAMLLLGAWAGSALILTGIVVRQNLVLRRCLRRASPIPIPPAFLLMGPPPGRLEAYAGERIQTPTFVGFLRPRLYLPEGWEDWPRDQLCGILAHEVAHHQARDLWVLLVQTVAVILFGLNPLVWLMHTRLTHIRELRCDETAMDRTGIHPVDYSRLLFAFVERQGNPPLPSVTGTFFSENACTISGRFHHVLHLSSGSRRRALWHYVALALAGLSILPVSYRWDGVFPGPFEGGVASRVSEGLRTLIEAGPAAAPVLQVVTHPAPVRRTAKIARATQAAPKPIGQVSEAGKMAEPVRPAEESSPAVARVADAGMPPASGEVSRFGDKRAYPEEPVVPSRDEVFTPVQRPPELVTPMRPAYPEVALQARVEGIVDLQILVTRNGELGDVKVVSGPQMLRETARKAAWESVWRPAIQNREAVDVWVTLPVRFALSGKGSGTP